jgi:hypothetical protein
VDGVLKPEARPQVMRPRHLGDESGIRHQTGPAPTHGDDHFAHRRHIAPDRHGREATAVDLKKRQIGPGVAPDNSGPDLARWRVNPELMVSIEQVIGNEDGLGIDRGTGRRAATPATSKDETRRGLRHGGRQIA